MPQGASRDRVLGIVDPQMGVEVVARMGPLTDSEHLREDRFEIDAGG